MKYEYLVGSFQVSLKVLYKELIRGWIFRLYYYNKLKKNEYSEKSLSQYIDSRLKKIGKSLSLDSKHPLEIKKILKNYNIISKQDIKSYPEVYESKKYGRFIFNYNKTTGTTGSPVKIKQTLECIQLEEAFVFRQLKWMGYKLGDRKVWLRGDIIIPLDTTSPPFWLRDFVTNTLYMSSYHISNETTRLYMEKLEQFDPVVIQAYPSSIGLLASWLRANNIFYQGKKLKGIMTSSEILNLDIRNIIEERFQCQVYDWYGQSERICAIGTCEYGNYHLLTDYSIVDFIDNNESKEIVGTSLNNLATPLVRYRTGDFVEMLSEKCQCARVFPLVSKVKGRDDDYIVLKDGRKFKNFSYIFKNIDGILEAQIIQNTYDTLIIKLVPSENFSDNNIQKIVDGFKDRIGDEVNIHIEKCTSIERGKNSKVKFIISNL